MIPITEVEITQSECKRLPEVCYLKSIGHQFRFSKEIQAKDWHLYTSSPTEGRATSYVFKNKQRVYHRWGQGKLTLLRWGKRTYTD